MSHQEQQAFFAALVRCNEALISGSRVLEVGSYDVNGTIRRFFAAAHDYVGVDLEEGPGVDVVAYGHEVEGSDGSFDVTISGECFEHDPYWRKTFENMVRLTRPGGLVAFTCASSGRPEHGTQRTLVSDSPGTQSEGLDYYQNLTAAAFDDLPLAEWFTSWNFWYMPTTFDLYFAGVRSGTADGRPSAELPPDQAVQRIRRMMGLPHRLVRLPLRAVRSVVGDGERYQRIILPYWLTMVRRFGAQEAERSVGG
jgi:SAM-dependent methyltransferase